MRQYSLLDQLIGSVDMGLRALFSPPPYTARPSPTNGVDQDDTDLSDTEKTHVGRLMRVNHSGEIAAQGLYQGQAITARDTHNREKLHQAAEEEIEHLVWCADRCRELQVPVSRLAGFWYMGSLVIGAVAGAFGDKWSLGFLAETEHQVVKHLQGHIDQLPPLDRKTRAVLERMKEDELKHATLAIHSGGETLPLPVRLMMKTSAKVMTRTAYWI